VKMRDAFVVAHLDINHFMSQCDILH